MIFKNNQEVSQNFDGELQFIAISVPCCTKSAEKKKRKKKKACISPFSEVKGKCKYQSNSGHLGPAASFNCNL